MLKQWLNPAPSADKEKSGQSGDKKDATAQRQAALEQDPEPVKELTPEELEEKRTNDIKRKLREASKEGPATPNNHVTYDSLFRDQQRVLMDGHAVDLHDGIIVNASRHVQNAQVSTKWTAGNPQKSGWDFNIQMNGFSDVMSVGYSTLGQWQLMYQRVFKTGALGVAQFMVQPMAAAMGGPPGVFYGMMQYPWVPGGCSSVSYVRGQHVNVSHAQKIVRGMILGTQMTYDLNTHKTTTTYGMGTTSADKTRKFCAELKPDEGEWKVGLIKSDWATDCEIGIALDYVTKKSGKASIFSVGFHRQLIGGGSLQAALSGFSRLKANLELPFGGDHQGVNQIKLNYCLQYDLVSGGVKHGLTLNL